MEKSNTFFIVNLYDVNTFNSKQKKYDTTGSLSGIDDKGKDVTHMSKVLAFENF